MREAIAGTALSLEYTRAITPPIELSSTVGAGRMPPALYRGASSILVRGEQKERGWGGIWGQWLHAQPAAWFSPPSFGLDGGK